MPQLSNGILVVFDGIDGAGKTTQVELLANLFRKVGLSVVTSKEPTDGEWGRKIRESATNGRMPLDEELHAFIMDRNEHIKSLIQPSLDNGKVVILDRYYYSTICYQGARGADKEQLRESVMSSAIKPDISFIMDVNPYISQERINVRDGAPNAFENLDYLKNVRDIYDWLCEIDSTLYELDANYPIDEIHSTIVKVLIDTVLKEKKCVKSSGCDDELSCGFAMTGACEWSSLRKDLLSSIPEERKYSAIKFHKD